MDKQEIEKAIEALWRMKQPRGWNIKCSNGEWMNDIYDIAIECMKQQLNNGWIPVNERLPEPTPEEIEDYIVAKPYIVTKIRRKEIYTIPAMYFFQRKEWHDCFGKGPILSNIIAWQPLPESFKEV